MIIFMALLWICPTALHVVLRAPDLDSDWVLQWLRRRVQTSSCWSNFFWCSLGYCWLSRLQACTAGSCQVSQLLGSHLGIPKSFSAELHSIHLSVSLYWCLELPWPMQRTLHLALLNFMKFAWAHLPSPWRSLCMVSLPSKLSAGTLTLMLSTNLVRVTSFCRIEELILIFCLFSKLPPLYSWIFSERGDNNVGPLLEKTW